MLSCLLCLQRWHEPLAYLQERYALCVLLASVGISLLMAALVLASPPELDTSITNFTVRGRRAPPPTQPQPRRVHGRRCGVG